MPRKRNPDSSHADKALRLFAKLFFNPRAYSLSELSETLNCSKSTVKRVIGELEESMPTPITIEKRGRQHFYSLPRREPVPAAMQITDAEIQSLAMCRAFAQALLGREEFDDATSGLEKSIALAYDSVPAVTDDTFSALNSGRIDYTPHEGTLRTLLDAIGERRVCRITHRKLAAGSEREYWAKPMKIFSHQDSVYVHVLPAKEPDKPFDSDTPDRILAVHRITSIEVTDRPYRVPETYDFERSMRGSFGVWQSEPFEVECEFCGWAADYVAEREWSQGQQITRTGDGCIRLRFTARAMEEVSRWVMGYGANVKVLGPPELVERVAHDLREAAGRYQP
jgi:predicted DNA-binding transcriptional regulator YafY